MNFWKAKYNRGQQWAESRKSVLKSAKGPSANLVLWLALLATSCAGVHLESSYKNPDVVLFHANRVLVVGMTPDAEAREKFESRLQASFEKRGVDAIRSIDLFDVAFTASERTEAELDRVEQQLLDKDFDAILFTKLVDVETRQSLGRQLSEMGKAYDRFRDDYLMHQGIYYNQDGTDPRSDYYAETALYCICVGKERELIWRSDVRISNIRNTEKVIREYDRLLMSALEEAQLIIGH